MCIPLRVRFVQSESLFINLDYTQTHAVYECVQRHTFELVWQGVR